MGIGAAAQRIGVAAHVLRHWEDEGVLAPGRDAQGHRRYTDEDLRVARGVRAGQAAGLSLAQIREFLTSSTQNRAALLDAHRGSLARQLDRLRASAATIDAVLGAEVDPDCPFGTPV